MKFGWLTLAHSPAPEHDARGIFEQLEQATFAEEFGFVGCFALLLAYGAIVAMCLRIASLSYSHFGRLSAAGVTATFALYILINGAMVMGLAPVVGVPMPLLSYGGTVMVTVNRTSCGVASTKSPTSSNPTASTSGPLSVGR